MKASLFFKTIHQQRLVLKDDDVKQDIRHYWTFVNTFAVVDRIAMKVNGLSFQHNYSSKFLPTLPDGFIRSTISVLLNSSWMDVSQKMLPPQYILMHMVLVCCCMQVLY